MRNFENSNTTTVGTGQKAVRANEQNEITSNMANSCGKMFALFSSNELTEVGNYHIIKLIGEGSFGKVYLAYHKLTHIKVVLKTGSKKDPNVVREVMFHKNFHFKHITKLFEVIVTENTVWMALEYCSGNELYEHLIQRGKFSLKETIFLFSQICGAVYYAHSMQCVHRDLKLENILLDDMGNAKLTDFGFTRDCSTKKYLETICGTTVYMAPELIDRKSHYDGYKIDVWALGIILYTMLSGFMPFDDVDEVKTKWQILHNEPNYNVSVLEENFENKEHLQVFNEDCKNLLSKLLNKDPYKRPLLKEILQHPFFEGYGVSFISMVDHEIQNQKTVQPFQSKFQAKLLKRLKKTGFDVNGIKNSVLKEKCDPLHGLWNLLVFKEVNNFSKTGKYGKPAGRMPKRSKSLLSVKNFFSDSQDVNGMSNVSRKSDKKVDASEEECQDLSLMKYASRKSMEVLSLKRTNTRHRSNKTAESIDHGHDSRVSVDNRSDLNGSSTSGQSSFKNSKFIKKLSKFPLFRRLENRKNRDKDDNDLDLDNKKRIRGDSGSSASKSSKKESIINTSNNDYTNHEQQNTHTGLLERPTLKKQKPSETNINSNSNEQSFDNSSLNTRQVTFSNGSFINTQQISSTAMKQTPSDDSSIHHAFRTSSISRPGSVVSEASNTTFASTDYSTDNEQLSSRYLSSSSIMNVSSSKVISGIQPVHPPTPPTKLLDSQLLVPTNRKFASPVNGVGSRRLLRRTYSNVSATSSVSDISSRQDSFYETSNNASQVSSTLDSHAVNFASYSKEMGKSTKHQTSQTTFPKKTSVSNDSNTKEKLPWFLMSSKSPVDRHSRLAKNRKGLIQKELPYLVIQEEETSSVDNMGMEEESDVELDDYDQVDTDNGNFREANNYPSSPMANYDYLVQPIPRVQSPSLSIANTKDNQLNDISLAKRHNTNGTKVSLNEVDSKQTRAIGNIPTGASEGHMGDQNSTSRNTVNV